MSVVVSRTHSFNRIEQTEHGVDAIKLDIEPEPAAMETTAPPVTAKQDVAAKQDVTAKLLRPPRHHRGCHEESMWSNLLKVVCCFCLVFVVATTFAPKPIGLLEVRNSTGHWGLCPRPTVCAEEWYTMLLLGISRSTAYATYPLMMLLFLSKTNHLRTLLQRSWLSMYVPFYDLHAIHVFAGKVVSVAVGVHAAAHTTRWSLQTDAATGRSNALLLLEHQTGLSGLVSTLCTPLITLPLIVPAIKKRMSWEWRKGLHYLSIVWGIAICFHAPTQLICYLIGVPVSMYLTDFAIGSLLRTYRIDSSSFSRLEAGVELTFEHPQGFITDGTGYVLVCLP